MFKTGVQLLDLQWLSRDCPFKICRLESQQDQFNTLSNAATLLAVSQGAREVTKVKTFDSNAKSFGFLQNLLEMVREFNVDGFHSVIYPIEKTFPGRNESKSGEDHDSEGFDCYRSIININILQQS